MLMSANGIHLLVISQLYATTLMEASTVNVDTDTGVMDLSALVRNY